MKVALLGLAITTSLIAIPASAACEMPALVASIPDGTSATEAELLAAQAEVRAYIAAMDEYIACENEALSTSGGDAVSEFLFQMATRIESARSEVDAVATRFNEQVEAFRAAQPPSTIAPPLPLSPSPSQPGSITPQAGAPPGAQSGNPPVNSPPR
jgi:hypothetical protein